MSPADAKRFIVIPFPFFGHIIPAIGLARNLSRVARVTFASMRASLAHIRARGELTAQDEKKFDVVAIDDGLPEGISEGEYAKWIGEHMDEIHPLVAKFVSAVSQEHAKEGIINYRADAFIPDIFLAKAFSQSAMHGTPYFFFHTASTEQLRDILNLTETHRSVTHPCPCLKLLL